jgi:hypothetical protein
MAVVAENLMKLFLRILKSLTKGVGDLSPNCRQAVRLQSDALDRPLSLGQRLGLRIHLLLCKWCRRYGRQITFLRAAAQKLDEHEQACLPPPLSAAARQRIKQRLQAGDKTNPA